jgi:hypothetical protein
MRCPGCHERVTLEINGPTQDFGFWADTSPNVMVVGQRTCPNPDCRTHVLIVYEDTNNNRAEIAASYPAERIGFEPTGVPERVLAAFEEAIACHAQQCYVAGAMMVRKTLEEVCRDRGATGGNLRKRIAALSTKVVLPQALLDGLDALRLLGNDAAHVESRDYEQVGQQEVEVAIDITKEILKSTYQLDSIVGRLTALQRAREQEDI